MDIGLNNRKRKAKEVKLDETINEKDLELEEFECPRCDQKYKTTTSLFGHMRQQHENPTICHICNKQLNALPNVLSHSYIHKKIKPYKCFNCSYQSRTRFNLKVHLGSCAGIEKFKYRKRQRLDKKGKSKKIIPNNLMITPNYSSVNHSNDQHLFDEIVDSGPNQDENRDDTFLIIIHKDYIPPKGTQLQLPRTSQLYANLQYLQYAQAIDDSILYHHTNSYL